MATLETQYKNWKEENASSLYTFEQWKEKVFTPMISGALNVLKEKDKYYTPDLEDLKIGYIFKYKTSENSENLIDGVILKDSSFKYIKERLELGLLFTKYLSKEDIESLGWQVKNIYQDSDNFDKNSFISFNKDKYEIRWWGKPDYIEIYESYQIGVFTPEDRVKKTEYDCIYQGTGKSINELKTIMKLLNIQ